jgi:hypothetical protein
MIKPYRPYEFMPPVRTFSLTSESAPPGSRWGRGVDLASPSIPLRELCAGVRIGAAAARRARHSAGT